MTPRQSHSRDLADRLQAEIDSGVYQPGERLPSVAAMATLYEVSPGIARSALNLLCRDHVVLGLPYIGHFVSITGGPLQRRDHRKLHVRVADDIRDKIANGVYKPGQRLPSMRKLADEHHMSTMPIQQAVKYLVSEGVLTAVHGEAVYVRAPGD